MSVQFFREDYAYKGYKDSPPQEIIKSNNKESDLSLPSEEIIATVTGNIVKSKLIKAN